MACHDVNHLTFSFDDAFDQKQLALQNFTTVPIENGFPDHNIAVAGFVFQRKEDDSGRGARSLSAGDNARYTDKMIMFDTH